MKNSVQQRPLHYYCSGGPYNLRGNGHLSQICQTKFFDNMTPLKKKQLSCFNPNYLSRVKSPQEATKPYLLGEVPRGTFKGPNPKGIPLEFITFEQHPTNPWASPYEIGNANSYKQPSVNDVCHMDLPKLA